MEKFVDIKRQAQLEVEGHREELVNLSLRIHAHPEVAFQEFKASQWLAEYLDGNGFGVEKGIAGLPTAFKAVYGSGKLFIGFLAEYDALPKLGHACGHNIIAASAVGGAVALRGLVDEVGGTLVVMGTPAEEGGGGKIIMAQNGAFEGLDMAMLVHPSVANRANMGTLARIALKVDYYGKAAHASARPQEGINALDAMVFAFNAVSSLRQHIRPGSRIHGVITHGGDAPNIIPDHTSAQLYVRTRSNEYLEVLKERVEDCFKAGALATGARLEYRWLEENKYAAMHPNKALGGAFSRNMEALGRSLTTGIGENGFGSTDLGNVSLILPAVHPTIAIAPREVASHSLEFAEAAASPAGHQGLVDAAKAMAMTAVDALLQPRLMGKIRGEFAKSPAH